MTWKLMLHKDSKDSKPDEEYMKEAITGLHKKSLLHDKQQLLRAHMALTKVQVTNKRHPTSLQYIARGAILHLRHDDIVRMIKNQIEDIDTVLQLLDPKKKGDGKK